MRRAVLLFFSVFVLSLLTWGGIFYWKNFRGIGPAFKEPPADIAEIIEKQPPPSKNATGFPLTLPPGFRISIFAKDLVAPRAMIKDQAGNLIVSITQEGKVVVLPDEDRDGVTDHMTDLIRGFTKPHGLALKCRDSCTLFVAGTDKVVAYDYYAQALRVANQRKIVDLPRGGGHFTRTLLFLPPPRDNELLISVGSSCNVCHENDWRRAKVLVAKENGSNLRTFASGLRNAVFMTLHPLTKQVWVTEMGRDLLGDDIPPDEINIVEEEKNYGWPTCYGKNVQDIDFEPRKKKFCIEPDVISSFIDIPAHSAPLGLAFIPHDGGWPKEYADDLLVAYHGSWNRTEPTGYKIVRYKLDAQGNYEGEEDFISGWLTPEGALGRPADILVEPNGTAYISDDKAGVIYRLEYLGNPR